MCLVSFKHNAWKWGSSYQIILFLTVWGSFSCFFQVCFHVSTLKRGLSLKPRLLECCSDVCPSEDFSHLHIRSWSSTRVTIRFFVTTLTKALLHQLLSLARRPALGRVLLFQTHSIKGKRGYMLLWTFNEAAFFSELFPRCVVWRNPVSKLYRQLFWPQGLVFALMCVISC